MVWMRWRIVGGWPSFSATPGYHLRYEITMRVIFFAPARPGCLPYPKTGNKEVGSNFKIPEEPVFYTGILKGCIKYKADADPNITGNI